MSIVGITGQAGSGKDTVADRLVKEHGFQKVALADPIKRFGYHVFGFSEEQLWGPSDKRNEMDPRFTLCEIRSANVDFGSKSTTNKLSRVCDGGWYVAAKSLLEYGPEWLQEVVPGCDVEEQMEGLCLWFATMGHKYPQLSPRIMLQHLGTEWGREYVNENVWVDCMLETSRRILEEGRPYNRKNGLGSDVTLREKDQPNGVVISDVRFMNEIKAIQEGDGKLIRVKRPKTDRKSTKVGITYHASEEEQKQFSDEMFDIIILNDGSVKDLEEDIDEVVGTL